ncbi:hypothetical protein QE152_g19451 [Popillia japonica]|uniref:Reverse transcriptase n=1 Tax=Popillia japonica TaxID=7064 RepID=A0AAW1KQL3_POPJA
MSWNLWEVFNETMSWNLEIEPNTVSLEGFEKIVKGAYRGACFSKEVKSRLQPYWWNEDIDKKRRECTASRRLVTRQKHKQGDTSEIIDVYRKHKKELQKLIRDSKRAHWNGLCEELEKDMWGRGYQIAVKKLIGYASFDLEPNQKKDIIRSLFPERRLARTERALDMEVKWFKLEELERAAQSLRSGKAPGIDGVPPEAIKRAAALAPEVMVRVQRKMLLRLASACRTVSASAVQVVTAMIPIELMVEERTRLGDGQGTKENATPIG